MGDDEYRNARAKVSMMLNCTPLHMVCHGEKLLELTLPSFQHLYIR